MLLLSFKSHAVANNSLAVVAFSDVVIDFAMDGNDVVLSPKPVDVAPFAGSTLAFQMYGSKDTDTCKSNFFALTYDCKLKKAYIRYTKSKLVEGKTIYIEEIRDAMGNYGSRLNEIIELAVEIINGGGEFQFDRVGLLSWNNKTDKLKITCPYTVPDEQTSSTCANKEYDLADLVESYTDNNVAEHRNIPMPSGITGIEPIEPTEELPVEVEDEPVIESVTEPTKELDDEPVEIEPVEEFVIEKPIEEEPAVIIEPEPIVEPSTPIVVDDNPFSAPKSELQLMLEAEYGSDFEDYLNEDEGDYDPNDERH